MDYNKPFNFLKNLPPKLNSFYKINSNIRPSFGKRDSLWIWRNIEAFIN